MTESSSRHLGSFAFFIGVALSLFACKANTQQSTVKDEGSTGSIAPQATSDPLGADATDETCDEAPATDSQDNAPDSDGQVQADEGLQLQNFRKDCRKRGHVKLTCSCQARTSKNRQASWQQIVDGNLWNIEAAESSYDEFRTGGAKAEAYLKCFANGIAGLTETLKKRGFSQTQKSIDSSLCRPRSDEHAAINNIQCIYQINSWVCRQDPDTTPSAGHAFDKSIETLIK